MLLAHFVYLCCHPHAACIADGMKYVSGGHLNPLVSLSGALSGHISWTAGITYIIAQVCEVSDCLMLGDLCWLSREAGVIQAAGTQCCAVLLSGNRNVGITHRCTQAENVLSQMSWYAMLRNATQAVLWRAERGITYIIA